MLTVKQVAQKLSISSSLAYRMVRTGEIPSYRIANCRRIKEEDLAAYIERSKVVEAEQRVPASSRRHF